MILSDFAYERPESLKDVVGRLAALGPKSRILAGGTDILPNMRLKIQNPEVLLSLGAVAPKPPMILPDGSLRLDALTRLHEIEGSEPVRSHHPMLARSAHAVGSNQTRQAGTLGGNLCQEIRCLYLNQEHDFQFVAPCYKRGGDCCYPYPRNEKGVCASVFMSDIAPALIALRADFELMNTQGTRRVAAEDFYTGDGMVPNVLGDSELICAVVLPSTPPLSGWGYHKSTIRGGLEFAMVVVAVWLSLKDDGKTCDDVRIAIGAVSERPSRAVAAENVLRGQKIDQPLIERAAAAAVGETRFLPHHNFSVEYLKQNAQIYLRRILTDATGRASGQTG
jgi:4-hydroxybenzoyl-CoA reductase subunit beta